MTFSDDQGNRIRVRNVDLMRLISKIDAVGEMQLIELLHEEYTRYGLSFRRGTGEADISERRVNDAELLFSALPKIKA